MSPAPPKEGVTRRRFIGAAGASAPPAPPPPAGASAAAAAALGTGACSSGSSEPSDRLNVLLLIVDSVRSDFVAAYGAPRVETPSMDALAAQGVRFTRFFPEAMPTVPARRTLMTGRRNFPFRGSER